MVVVPATVFVTFGELEPSGPVLQMPTSDFLESTIQTSRHENGRDRGVFQIIKTKGGETPPPTPPQTKVTMVGKNEIYNRENLVGPFFIHKLWVPNPPPLLKRLQGDKAGSTVGWQKGHSRCG